jgi:2-dehydropantoate 2-reductase
MARYLVMGCGGIGGIVSALLSESGQDTTSITTNQAIFDAVEQRGFQIRNDGAPRGVKGRILREIPAGESFDYVLLCTQPPQVEQAARTALAALKDTGFMVCFQNGLCESRVAAICGAPRTLGGVIAWGAAMTEPGLYERTAHGGFTIGAYEGVLDEGRCADLLRALEAIGPVECTRNLAGKRWSKLAINAAISSLGTLGGDRLGPLMQHRFVRRLALEVMTEAVHVARAEGVRLEKVAGTLDLDFVALTDGERHAVGAPGLVAKHALLLAVGFRYRRMRSSMLCAIERGRVPAVDFLNGEIVSRGRKLGIDTRINERVRQLVWDVANGKRTPGLALLRELYASTASARRD